MDEKHLLRPVDVNGINKMAGEWYHILYNNVYGIRACALRLTNTYGPRMRVKDARQTFLGIWIRLLVEGKPFEVWDGEQLRDFTYVDDAVDAFLLAAAGEEANGQVFNLGGGEVISLRELADLLVKVNGGGRFHVRAFPADRKRIDIGDYYADDRRIRSELGWTPRVNLQEGLARTLDYYRGHLQHYLMSKDRPTAVPQTDPKAGYLAHRQKLTPQSTGCLKSGWYILGTRGGVLSSRNLPPTSGCAMPSVWPAAPMPWSWRCGPAAVGPGDLVFTVSHTAVATVAAIELAGATPVLVDIDPVTYTMDPNCLESSIDPSSGGHTESGHSRASLWPSSRYAGDSGIVHAATAYM